MLVGGAVSVGPSVGASVGAFSGASVGEGASVVALDRAMFAVVGSALSLSFFYSSMMMILDQGRPSLIFCFPRLARLVVWTQLVQTPHMVQPPTQQAPLWNPFL